MPAGNVKTGLSQAAYSCSGWFLVGVQAEYTSVKAASVLT